MCELRRRHSFSHVQCGEMKWKSLRVAFSTKPLTHSSWQCSTAMSLSATKSCCCEKLERLAQLLWQLNDSVEWRRVDGEFTIAVSASSLLSGAVLIVQWIFSKLLCRPLLILAMNVFLSEASTPSSNCICSLWGSSRKLRRSESQHSGWRLDELARRGHSVMPEIPLNVINRDSFSLRPPPALADPAFRWDACWFFCGDPCCEWRRRRREPATSRVRSMSVALVGRTLW